MSVRIARRELRHCLVITSLPEIQPIFIKFVVDLEFITVHFNYYWKGLINLNKTDATISAMKLKFEQYHHCKIVNKKYCYKHNFKMYQLIPIYLSIVITS